MIGSVIDEILALQKEYSSANTLAMQRRGHLIRHTLLDNMRGRLPDFALESGIADLAIGASDGAGRKAEIPWVRIYSRERSPRATEGWYVVWLFSKDGSSAFLSINQGTNTWSGGDLKRRPVRELTARADWARSVIVQDDSADPDWISSIDLQGSEGGLGLGYEAGNVLAKGYSSLNKIDETGVAAALTTASRWLGLIYRHQDAGLQAPGDPAPEIVEAEGAVAAIAGVRRSSGRGFRPSAGERILIERLAVDTVTSHLESLGYAVKDVGATRSYDLLASKPEGELFVEVKGTTSDGSEILLTQNEVLLHQGNYPANALGIVHSIHLDRDVDPPQVAGGILVFEQPWLLDSSRLEPIAYRYLTTAP